VTALLLKKAIFYLEGSFPPPIILVSLYVYPMQSYQFQNNYFNIFFCAGASDIYTIHNSLNLSQDSSEILGMLLHL